MKRRLPAWALLVLPVLPLLLQAGKIAFAPGSPYTDLLVSHYPNAIFLQRSLLSGQGIPFWSGLIFSGYPFVANPLSGLHYPPGWLALALPLPFGLNLLVIAHLVWGGVGLYRFLRLEGLQPTAALFGGLFYCALPRLYAHYAAGHVTLLYAVSWLPWLLAVEATSARKHNPVTAGALLGLCTLADPRMGVYAGLLWAAWKAHVWLRSRAVSWRTLLISYATNAICAVLVAAPMLLPLAQFVAHSTRSQLTSTEALVYSLPPAQLLGLLFPNPRGEIEWMGYAGAACLAFLSLTLLRNLPRRTGFWLGVLLVSILFALGEYFAPAQWLAHLPGLSLLRVPARALILSGVALAVLAARSLDCWLAGGSGTIRSAKAVRLVLTALSALVVLFAIGGAAIAPQTQVRQSLLWGAGFWLAALALVFAMEQKILPRTVFAPALIGLCLLDWMGVNLQMLEYRSLSQVFAGGQRLTAALAQSGLEGRLYTPSYSLPQHVAAQSGVEQANGVDPLQLAGYAAFFAETSGVPSQGYSVTLPPFATGDPAHDNAAYVPDPQRLGWLAVDRVAAAFPLKNLELVDVVDGVYLYRNPQARPLAWMQQPGPALAGDWWPVQALTRMPNQIDLSANGPGLLVLSEVAYPGWRVWVDGAPAQPQLAGGLLRAVAVPAGVHAITWRYQPWSFLAGWGLFCLGLAWVWFGARRAH